MKHLAAYLLLALGGNSSPSAADVKKVLESVGIEADSDRLDTLISELNGKDINEVRPTTRNNPTRSILTTPRSSLPVPRSSLPSPRAAVVAAAPAVVLLPPLVATPLLRRRRRRRLRSPTRTWASVSSTKRLHQRLKVASAFSGIVMAWFRRFMINVGGSGDLDMGCT